MDKLVRKIIDKTTGLPISGAYVKARPKDVGAAGDIDMAEIGATGTYATAAEVPHNTYGIIVNGTDSLDEATPEPGRVGVTKADGTKVYSLIDRVLDSKVTLSSFLADGDSSPTSSTLLTAIAAATGSKPRTLVLDADVSLDSASSVSGNDLNLDLNGHLLTLSTASSSITSGTRRIRVFNGRIQVSNVNCRIQGTGTNFSMVQFSGTMTAFARNDCNMTFDGCDGLSALVGANLSGSISSVGSGSHGFGTASQLKLTTQGSTAGNGRLVKLQSFVDGWYDNLVGYIHTAANWLDATRRNKLDQWVNMSDAARASVASYSEGFSGNTNWRKFQSTDYYDAKAGAYILMQSGPGTNPYALGMAGLLTGCKVTTTPAGAIAAARIVCVGVAQSNGAAIFTAGQNSNEMDDIIDFVSSALIGVSDARRVSVKPYKVTYSGGVANISPLRMMISGYAETLQSISVSVSGVARKMLWIKGVTSNGSTTVADGDTVIFDITVTDRSVGVNEPSVPGA